MSSPESEPRHNATESRYEMSVDGHLAVAEYVRAGDRMIFTHTYVPPALRGGGIAAQLVAAALEHARRENLRIVPQCSYVARYIERHPEFAPFVEK